MVVGLCNFSMGFFFFFLIGNKNNIFQWVYGLGHFGFGLWWLLWVAFGGVRLEVVGFCIASGCWVDWREREWVVLGCGLWAVKLG